MKKEDWAIVVMSIMTTIWVLIAIVLIILSIKI